MYPYIDIQFQIAERHKPHDVVLSLDNSPQKTQVVTWTDEPIAPIKRYAALNHVSLSASTTDGSPMKYKSIHIYTAGDVGSWYEHDLNIFCK